MHFFNDAASRSIMKKVRRLVTGASSYINFLQTVPDDSGAGCYLIRSFILKFEQET